MRFTCSTCN